MASGLPNDFLSWKSFQSLTQTAALAWMVTLIIDVIFIQGIDEPRTQLTWIWIVGFTICFILACIRLYYNEEKERGDKFMLLFNAALIFLYASGFNGFTKELGSWSDLNEFGKEAKSSVNGPQKKEFKAAIASFVPNIFSKQTAIWPDVKMMNENQVLQRENLDLKRENQIFQEAIRGRIPADNAGFSDKIKELEAENERLYTLWQDCQGYECTEYLKIIKDLNGRIGRLNDSLNSLTSSDCLAQERRIKELQDELNKLRKQGTSAECEEIRKSNETLSNENNRLGNQKDILLERIDAYNRRVREYKGIIEKYSGIKEQQRIFYANIYKQFNSAGGPRYTELVQEILNNEIDTKVP